MEKNIIKKIAKVDNLFKMPQNDNMKIIFDTSYIEEPFQKELNERVELFKNIEKNPEKEKIKKILYNTSQTTINFEKYLFKIFTNDEKYININTENIYNDNKKYKIYNNIFYRIDLTKNINKYLKQKNNIKKYKKILVYNIFQCIKYSYKHLLEGGSCYFLISFPNIDIINTLYFLNKIFNEVFIVNKFIVFCKSFKKDQNQIKIINDIEKNNYNFNIEQKINEKKLIKYFKNLIKIDYYYKKKLINDNKYNSYLYFKYFSNVYDINTLNSLYSKNYKKNLKNIYKKIIKNIDVTLFNNTNNNDIYLDELK